MHKILLVTILLQSSFICAPPKSLKELVLQYLISCAKEGVLIPRSVEPIGELKEFYSIEKDPFEYVKSADSLSFAQDTEEGVEYMASLLAQGNGKMLNDCHSKKAEGQLGNFVQLSNKVNALPEHLSAAIWTARNALNDVKRKNRLLHQPIGLNNTS